MSSTLNTDSSHLQISAELVGHELTGWRLHMQAVHKHTGTFTDKFNKVLIEVLPSQWHSMQMLQLITCVTRCVAQQQQW